MTIAFFNFTDVLTCVNIEICAIRVICERPHGLTLVNLIREIEEHLRKQIKNDISVRNHSKQSHFENRFMRLPYRFDRKSFHSRQTKRDIENPVYHSIYPDIFRSNNKRDLGCTRITNSCIPLIYITFFGLQFKLFYVCFFRGGHNDLLYHNSLIHPDMHACPQNNIDN